MRRRHLILLLGGAVAALPLAARAQQHAKLKRIGFLRVRTPPPAWIAAFRQGLREHGLIEGQNIEIELGLAESVAELPSVAAELVRRKVDVLLASGSPTVLPARDAAGTIPVVFVGIFDFVETGQVASLARPGGNLTGMSGMVVDLAGKRMQLLKELLPGMTRVAILVRTASPATPPFVREAQRSAQVLGLELQVLRMANPSDLEMLLASASTAGGLIGSDDAVFTAHRLRIAELALKQRLPTMFGFREMVQAGCLISYGADYADLYRRAASHVHKILNGARPAAHTRGATGALRIHPQHAHRQGARAHHPTRPPAARRSGHRMNVAVEGASNMAVERTAGSPPLAAAAHRRRSPNLT